MLSCKELAHQHASDYLDGQLSPRTRLAMSFHLALCTNCRRFLKQFRAVRQLLQSRSELQVDEKTESEVQDLAARLHDSYRQQKNNSSGL